ncbi:MAG: HlyD family efflux transporter periplasmic adaptor subunit [Thermodesulfobacteriota bacterium]|nr:HlyD family efflux transporter periplasmic adaptor subunit [Thermodesulfobacteriota bacterium]
MNVTARRKLYIIIIILVAVLATLYGFIPKAVDVDLVDVSRGPLQVTIAEEGRTRLKERYVISAPASGYIRRVDAKVGDRVEKGQAVVALEPLRSQSLDPRSRAEAEAVVSAAKAALEAAREKERAAAAEADYVAKRSERIAKLYSKGYVAKDQFDQTESELEKARAAGDSAKAAVDVARYEYDRARATLRNFNPVNRDVSKNTVYISSPVSGNIFKIHRESEGAVSTGEPLMDIGNQENLEVITEVLSSDAVKIKKGTSVLFKRWGGDKPLSGTVRIVEPAGFTKFSSLGVEEQRVIVIADIASPPETWRALGDGYRLESHFIVWEGQDVLQVPASSLFRSGEKWAVFVGDKGKARLRIVEVGQRNGLTAGIKSGINAGEKVIAHPGDLISDGTRIRAGN